MSTYAIGRWLWSAPGFMVVISVLWLVRFSFHPDDQAALIVGNIWLVGANLSRHK